MNPPKIAKIVGWVLLGLLAAVGLGLLFGLLVVWLWNALMPDIFGLPEISYWQAVGLIVLAHIFIKSHNHGGGHEKNHSPKKSIKSEFKKHFEEEFGREFKKEIAQEIKNYFESEMNKNNVENQTDPVETKDSDNDTASHS